MTTIRYRHIKALGYCNRGTKKWLEARGVTWSDFLRDGLPGAEDVEDGMVQKLVELVRQEEKEDETVET
jgi:hypothetical protein